LNHRLSNAYKTDSFLIARIPFLINLRPVRLNIQPLSGLTLAMPIINHFGSGLFGVALLVSASTPGTPAPVKPGAVYSITRLGGVMKVDRFQIATIQAGALNNSGQMVGRSEVYLATGLEMHAMVVEGAKMQDLGNLGGNRSEALAVNQAGQVVGISANHAFLFSQGKMQDLNTLGGAVSRANAINAAGQIAGQAETADGSLHAFLYRDGKMTDLGAPDVDFSKATALNDAGQVVGIFGYWTNRKDGLAWHPDDHAFLYDNGKMQDLGTLGGRMSQAFAINASGQIVGWAENADGAKHAFIYRDGKMSDLGVLGWSGSLARSINTAGDVVGVFGEDAHYQGGVAEGRAFLYRGGRMHDLNSVISKEALAAAGVVVLTDAKAINDRGQIVCAGEDPAGVSATFLLTPVEAKALDAALANDPPPAMPGWTLTALGTLGGDSSHANAINDAGQIVGAADTNLEYPESSGGRAFSLGGRLARDPYYAHAFLYADGKMQDLTVLGGNDSEANAINSSGQVVGQVGGLWGRPFLYSDGQMSNLGYPGGGLSRIVAINASGQIAGLSSPDPQIGGKNQAAYFRDGKLQEINFDEFFGKESGAVSITGMNDAGWIIGGSYNFMTRQGYSFIYHPEGWLEFIGIYSSAVNAAGQVVGQGTAGPNGQLTHAFIYRNGQYQELNIFGATYSAARAINASGQVVGSFGTSIASKEPAQGHAFVYRDGQALDLNLIVGEAGLAAAGFKVLYTATGINSRGQIVGTGLDLKGHDLAFRLTPPLENK